MKAKAVAGVVLSALLSVLVAAPAPAVIVEVTFDSVPVQECYETWTEVDLTMMFVETTADDCDGGGNCYWGVGDGVIWLYPSRFVADFSAAGGAVLGAEVDIEDYCGVGCTRAFFYGPGDAIIDMASNAEVSEPETLILTAGGEQPEYLAVSSCEGEVSEIRIEIGPTPVGGTSWSAVKALY